VTSEIKFMAPSRQKPARDFIPMGVNESSDDEIDEILSVGKPLDKNIGIDDNYSDDGEGLYSNDDESEYSEEDAEEYDDDEEVEDEDGSVDDIVDDEDIDASNFDDGDPADLAHEDDEDEEDYSENEDDSGHDNNESEGEEEPVEKKPRGLGELAKKLSELENEIADIESKQIDKKHWTLTGEVTAKSRPLNSILEANIELPFGHMAGKRLDTSEMELMVDENDFDPENPEKPVFDIDLIIKQRVADRTFDDIIRRKVETAIIDDKPKDKLEGLDFEKSQLGLADVYAKQYEKDIFNQSEETEKQSAEKEQAKAVFAKLMHKLDSLTNFSFAPRPPMIRKGGENGTKDLPAMKLEEPIPLIVSSSVRANSAH
jgi:U3 small nucleolar RNA-associated protein MPP10